MTFGITYVPRVNRVCNLTALVALLGHHMRFFWAVRGRFGGGAPRSIFRSFSAIAAQCLLVLLITASGAILIFQTLHWLDAKDSFGHWYWAAESTLITAGIWFVPVVLALG